MTAMRKKLERQSFTYILQNRCIAISQISQENACVRFFFNKVARFQVPKYYVLQ